MENTMTATIPADSKNTMTATINADALPKLTTRIGQLAKRAAKLGVAPLWITSSVPYAKSARQGKYYEAVDVEINGESPKLAGWSLIAVLDHDTPDHKVMVLRVPGDATVLPVGIETRGTYCDHCQTSRRRLETFAVKHDDGRIMVVGRQCVADFLGGISPDGLLAWASWVQEISDTIDEELNGGSGGGKWLIPTEEYLTRVAQVIRTDGWMPKSKAENGRSTSALALALQCPGIGDKPEDATADDVKVASLALAWAREIPEGGADEYLDKLGRVARWEAVPHKYLGILASAVSAHARFEARELARTQAVLTSKHIGEVGVRIKSLDVKVTGLKFGQGDYGPWTLVNFITPDGAILAWFGTGQTANGMETGQVIKIAATVKKHESRNGIAQTMVTRVKVVTK